MFIFQKCSKFPKKNCVFFKFGISIFIQKNSNVQDNNEMFKFSKNMFQISKKSCVFKKNDWNFKIHFSILFFQKVENCSSFPKKHFFKKGFHFFKVYVIVRFATGKPGSRSLQAPTRVNNGPAQSVRIMCEEVSICRKDQCIGAPSWERSQKGFWPTNRHKTDRRSLGCQLNRNDSSEDQQRSHIVTRLGAD